MFRLNFTTKVIGEDGAEKVRRHDITQTLRSPRDDIVAALLNSTLKIGDQMEVALDGEVIGKAYTVLIDRINWDGLTLDDATRGGFSNKNELYAALKRAGYRFLDIDKYLFYRVLFTWLKG